MYQPILKKDGTKRNVDDPIEPLRRENRFNVKVHTNPDVKVLWYLKDDLDLSKDICSCIIDCEVVDIWPQRFEELKAFIDENERRPAGKSKNPEEKKLGRWLQTQQYKYKNKIEGMKHEQRYNLWSHFLEEYKEHFISDDEKWLQNFEELNAFINMNKKTPTQQSKNAKEKNLGSWLSRQQKNYKNKTDGMKHEERYKLWTQFLEEYKEYFITNDEVWFKQFEELKTFIDTNNKRPAKESKNKEENQLGHWVSNQQHCYKRKTSGMKDQARYNLWTKFLEECKKYFITNDEVWFKQFEELKIFITENEKNPSDSSKDPKEKQLGQWISSQQNYYKKKIEGMKDQVRYNLWTQFLEEYKEYFITNDEVWFKQFEELKTFINENERKPSDISKDPKEKNLGSWLSHQQQTCKKKDRIMKVETIYNLWLQFLEEYKEHFISKDEKWFQKFEELKLFINENLKRPIQKSKNNEERKLAEWLSSQHTNYKNKIEGMKDQERYNLWTQFLEEYNEYIATNDEIRLQNFEKLKIFIDMNKRKPFQKSKNIEEKQLGNWLTSQQSNYKKKVHSMKDEEQYNLWTQFLEEYKEYFVNPTEEIENIVKPKQKKSVKLTKINPNPIKKEETKEETYIRTKPLITQFHNKFCKMRSDNLANHFQQNPSDFAEYHRVRDECFKTFEPEDIPCNRVIMELEKIKTKRGGKHVVDMGCGTAKIFEHFKDDPRFHFINYDHVAINDTVQVCDISHMQLEDDSVDICIMSLALWGSNCEEYIKEAYRVLETNSTLYIIDSTKRWSEEGTQNATILKEMLETAGFQITTETIDKWCYFKGTKVPYNL